MGQIHSHNNFAVLMKWWIANPVNVAY